MPLQIFQIFSLVRLEFSKLGCTFLEGVFVEYSFITRYFDLKVSLKKNDVFEKRSKFVITNILESAHYFAEFPLILTKETLWPFST